MGENQGDKGGFTQLIDNLLIVRGKEFTSIGDLEKKARIGQRTLRDAYKGNRFPKGKTMEKLLNILGVTLEQFSSGIFRPTKESDPKDSIIEVLKSQIEDKKRIISMLEQQLEDCQKNIPIPLIPIAKPSKI